MKSKIIKAFIVALMLPAAIAMTSCKEIDSKELYLYLNTELQPVNEMVCNVDIEIHKTGNVVRVSGQDSLTFPVKANRPLPASATCAFAPNAALVDTYNREHNTEAILLPAEFYEITGTASLKEGQMVGTDSVTLELVNLTSLDVNNPLYVLPLSIVSISSDDKGLSISSNRSTIYAVVNVKSEEFNMAMTDEAGITGTVITKGEISVSGTSSPSRLNDGKANTAWNPQQNTSAFAIFTFTTPNTFTGFRTWPDYQYAVETVRNCGIEVSDDKVTWTGQGYVTLPATEGNSTNPVWRYTSFDEPITGKYIRLTSLSSYDSNGWTGLSEVEFYKQ